MMYRYLIIDGIVWGKHELTKDYFVGAVQRGATILDLQENKQFDASENKWVDIEGDE